MTPLIIFEKYTVRMMDDISHVLGMNETMMDDSSIQFWTEGVLLTTVSVLGTLANVMR
jgi:hypothetical protein